MTALSNSEQAVVDATATAIAKKLDVDHPEWRVDDKSEWLKNGPLGVLIRDGSRGVMVDLDGAGRHYVNGRDSSASQEHIWSAYKRWQERRILASLRPKDPTPAYVPPPKDGRWFVLAAVCVLWIPFALWTAILWWASRQPRWAVDGQALPGTSPADLAWNAVETGLNVLWFPAGIGLGVVGLALCWDCYDNRRRVL